MAEYVAVGAVGAVGGGVCFSLAVGSTAGGADTTDGGASGADAGPAGLTGLFRTTGAGISEESGLGEFCIARGSEASPRVSVGGFAGFSGF